MVALPLQAAMHTFSYGSIKRRGILNTDCLGQSKTCFWETARNATALGVPP
jgi:hypothetical protein